MASLKTSIIMVCLNVADLNVGWSGTLTQLLIPSKNCVTYFVNFYYFGEQYGTKTFPKRRYKSRRVRLEIATLFLKIQIEQHADKHLQWLRKAVYRSLISNMIRSGLVGIERCGTTTKHKF